MRLTGQPLDTLFAAQRSAPLPYNVLAIALVPEDRTVLHKRIAWRFEEMLNAGLIEEVEILREKYVLDAEMPSMRCVGYRQVWEMIEGTLPRSELLDRGIYATRQLAKRQLTWLRGMADIERHDPLEDDCTKRILQRTELFLG